MGESGSICVGHCDTTHPIRAEKYSVQIQGSSFSSLGQWAPIYKQGIQIILFRVWNKKCIFLTLVSPIQWAGQGHEQDTARILEKVFDYDKREVGRRVTNSPLDLSNNSKAAYKGDVVHPGLWL